MGCAGSKEAPPPSAPAQKPKDVPANVAAKPAANTAHSAPKAPPAPAPKRTDSWKARAVPGIDTNFGLDATSMATYTTGSSGGEGGLYGLLGDGKKAAEDWAPTAQSRPVLSVHPSDDLTPSAAAPGGAEATLTLEGVAMTIPWRVLLRVAPGSDAAELRRAALAALEAVLSSADRTYNNWNKESEIEKAQATAAKEYGKGAPLSDELAAVLMRAEEYVHVSGGRFDPTVAPLLRAWRQALDNKGRPPTASDLTALNFALGWKNVTVKKDASGYRLLLKNGNTRLDLGGYTKGLAVDQMCDALRRGTGVSDFMVEWGGDIKAVGQHPSGRPWRTAVIRPPPLQPLFKLWNQGRILEAITPDLLYRTASLRDLSIATSGDYFQIHKYGYHHILHPGLKQLMKANEDGVASVSVAAESCADADAYATAAFVCGSITEASKFLRLLKAEGRITAFAVLGRRGAPVLEGEIFAEAAAAAAAAAAAGVPESGLDTSAVKVEVKEGANGVAAPAALSESAARDLSDALATLAPPSCTAALGEGAAAAPVTGFDTCSLEPPLVSFFAPPGAAGAAPGDAVHVSLPDASADVHGSVRSVHVAGSQRLVIADVDKVEQPSSPLHENVKDGLKSLMSRVPAPATVVTYCPATGGALALTATSVRAETSGALVLNVQKTSKAHLGLTAIVGVRLAVHFLAAGQEAAARAFASESELPLDPQAFSERVGGMPGGVWEGEAAEVGTEHPPRFGAGLVAVARVESVVDAGDHSVLIGRVEEVHRGPQPLGDLLVWRDRSYAKAANV